MGGEPRELLVPDGLREQVLDVVDHHQGVEPHEAGSENVRAYGAQRWLRTELQPDGDPWCAHGLRRSVGRLPSARASRTSMAVSLASGSPSEEVSDRRRHGPRSWHRFVAGGSLRLPVRLVGRDPKRGPDGGPNADSGWTPGKRIHPDVGADGLRANVIAAGVMSTVSVRGPSPGGRRLSPAGVMPAGLARRTVVSDSGSARGPSTHVREVRMQVRVLVAESTAMMAIGDGVLAALFPVQHIERWDFGPKAWRAYLHWFSERPGLSSGAGRGRGRWRYRLGGESAVETPVTRNPIGTDGLRPGACVEDVGAGLREGSTERPRGCVPGFRSPHSQSRASMSR